MMNFSSKFVASKTENFEKNCHKNDKKTIKENNAYILNGNNKINEEKDICEDKLKSNSEDSPKIGSQTVNDEKIDCQIVSEIKCQTQKENGNQNEGQIQKENENLIEGQTQQENESQIGKECVTQTEEKNDDQTEPKNDESTEFSGKMIHISRNFFKV